MKKQIITAVAILCSIYNQAQTLIPKVGISVSSLQSTEYVQQMTNQFGSSIGYTISLGYNLPINIVEGGLFSIQPEITFLQKGFKVDAKGEFVGDETYILKLHDEFTINYLEFPVLAKIEYAFGKTKLAMFAGPSIGFGLGGSYKAIGTKTTATTTEEIINTEGNIKFFRSKNTQDTSFDHNVDLAMQVGIELTFINRIVIDMRFGNSFTHLNEYSNSQNRVLQFTIGTPIVLK